MPYPRIPIHYLFHTLRGSDLTSQLHTSKVSTQQRLCGNNFRCRLILVGCLGLVSVWTSCGNEHQTVEDCAYDDQTVNGPSGRLPFREVASERWLPVPNHTPLNKRIKQTNLYKGLWASLSQDWEALLKARPPLICALPISIRVLSRN